MPRRVVPLLVVALAAWGGVSMLSAQELPTKETLWVARTIRVIRRLMAQVSLRSSRCLQGYAAWMPLAFFAVTLLAAPTVSAQCFTPIGNTLSLGGPFVVADFNGDGKMDVAGPATPDANFVAVSLGNGDGTLQPAMTFAVGSFPPRSVAVGDFNGDGKLDLATANTRQYEPGNVSILLGNGDGTFGPAVNYTAGTEPFSVAVGDFNADGKLDLAVANRGDGALDPGSLSILLGIGDGRFRPAVSYAVGTYPMAVVVGDFNRDGKLDLAVANRLSRNISILLGNGDGTFPTPVPYGPGHSNVSIAVSDFNGDGIQDLAVGNDDPLPGGLPGGHYISILIGGGDGSFPTAVDYPATVSIYGGASSFAIGDYNGDRRPDIALGNVTRPIVSILLGNGDGTFQAGLLYSTNQGGPIAAADLNGDGKVDLLVTLAEVNVWLNGCTGAYADISIMVDDNQTTAIVGSTVTYAIVAANAGPSSVSGATVTDIFPAAITGPITWACYASSGSSCGTASGTGNILGERVNVSPGGWTVFVATGMIDANAAGILQNTATITLPGGFGDPNRANNAATDIDSLLVLEGLSITLKVNGQHPTPPTVTVTGPTLLTLDMSAGNLTTDVDWYWALYYNGTLYWVTPGGISTTQAPWFRAPPASLSNETLVDFTLPPASSITSILFLVNGTSIVSLDYITATRP